ncbi:MAG TPA: TonB-dependent receptor [Gemmatimonadaceae bacterium]|nr:TonB-dependent receptor [Gemmatimonadaceae bacterium]
MPLAGRPLLGLALVLVLAPGARAQSADTSRRALDTVHVVGRIDDLIGSAASASEGRIGAAELRRRPLAREGEVLETVPGVIVTQHSGEGKANQYFVRGFNLDHGTDFRTSVEGMPVNMPTHGHGQGYTDLGFLVPELVDHLEYRLGVHHAALGDFASAGGADIHLVRTLDRPFVSLSGGGHGLARVAGAGARRVAAGDLLVGGETKMYDGPWLRAQALRKASGLARYSWSRGASRFSVLGLAYRNRWNATDQIALRAVDAGALSRFGQLDSTAGGAARRYSFSGTWSHVGDRSVQRLQLFGIRSDLRLHSNFTYFLDDPIRGDQFEQVDRRTVIGGGATHRQAARAFGVEHALMIGAESRVDLIDDLGLYRTERRRRLATVREDRVRQSGTGLFVEAESRWTPQWRSVVGVRGDAYSFDVASDRAENSGRRAAGIVSPKASVAFAPSASTELYASGGFGFHSNDARGTVIRIDPAKGAPVAPADPLVRSRGAELGLRLSPTAGARTTLSVWTLALASELVFVGDAGGTEASAATRRHGVTLASFWRPSARLGLDGDVSLARARFTGVEPRASRIPGALERVVAAGASWSAAPGELRRAWDGAFGGVRVRHFGAYALTEDGGVRARPSTLLSADAGYRLGRGTRLQLAVLNVANAAANDIEYWYASRLPGEEVGVAGVHAHPVEPTQLRVTVERRF